LARVASGDNINGVVLAAEHQTAGTRRHGRQWFEPPGSQITLSVGVGVAEVPMHAWGWLPLATGVAVVDALNGAASVTAGLKWPNDVLAGDGKLAGLRQHAELGFQRQEGSADRHRRHLVGDRRMADLMALFKLVDNAFRDHRPARDVSGMA
jgi:hypothetical protein